MAQEPKDESVVDVEEAFSKTEQFIDENKKPLLIAVSVIVAVVAIYIGFKKFYLADLEQEAMGKMFYAEQLFEKDSLDAAINGALDHPGFLAIADEYSLTKSGNLAHYYLGVAFLRKGEFEKSIEQFNEFDADDQMLFAVSKGATGDAYMELGKVDEAISQYIKAAEARANKFTSPVYLKKAGLAYEEKGSYADAIKVYEKIKNEYSTSQEGRDIEKYIAHAKTLAGM